MNNSERFAAVLLIASLIPHPSSLVASDFRLATPGYEFVFPRDHGSHPEYRTEWWYFTGHLRTASGRRYGFEVTFFRVGITPPGPKETRWDLQHVMPAHFAVTDLAAKKFRYYEKLNRASPFTAEAAVGRLDVFNEGWRLTMAPDGSWRLVASEGTDAIDLVLRARKPPAVHGENGVSIKAQGAGFASHYYSMTRLEASGTINGERANGQAWMDHEFGSSALRENQQGWDWFSIQLDNDSEVMLYIIRKTDGTPDVTSSGSLITSDGRVIHIRREQMRITPLAKWTSKQSGATYPMGWRVELPRFGVMLTLRPLMREQELVTHGSTRVTYWEGAVDVTGSFAGVAVRGDGYVEMTGYDKAFRAP
ncbi:MAG TPA: lipocalin-like domain-containing protein [Thermoanaerobaculia bacterium]|nr:lipocalin-like domain-containing protein [Thermoanaerobaculia bacterium]